MRASLRIRGGSGLGDALYVRPIAEHYAKRNPVTVLSNYPDVFIGAGVEVEPFGRNKIDVLAHYTAGKQRTDSTQWEDACRSARIEPIPLRFDWTIQNHALVNRMREKAEGDPFLLVHGGRTPMGRTDGFGAELLPNQKAFDAVLNVFADCYTVRIGKGEQIYPLHVDEDLNGSTSVSDLLDLAFACDGIIGQCSFVVPLAECFGKPLLAIWSAKGMEQGRHPYIRAITPQKVLSGERDSYVMDDWDSEKIRVRALGFAAYTRLQEAA